MSKAKPAEVYSTAISDLVDRATTLEMELHRLIERVDEISNKLDTFYTQVQGIHPSIGVQTCYWCHARIVPGQDRATGGLCPRCNKPWRG
jgi:hypothetical protein